MTPFRCEKNTNWEGAFRVPCLVRWPGTIKPGTVTNEIMSHNDWIPTLCAIAGEPDIVEQAAEAATRPTASTYKVHLDGYDQSKFLRNVSGTAATTTAPRARATSSSTPTTTACSCAMRQGDYKYVFSEQRDAGHDAASGPSRSRRCACRRSSTCVQDPFERADITSNTFWDWQLNHVGSMYGVMDEVFQFAETFKEFPPRSFPPSFNPANILESTLEACRRLREAAGPNGSRLNE